MSQHSLTSASNDDLERYHSLLMELEENSRVRMRDNPLKWYDFQMRYFESSLAHKETLLMAGNQVGKSQCAAYEDALDLTGDYPPGWCGFSFDSPITLWLLGVSSDQLRDVLQKQLFGELLDNGTFTGGWVHPDEVIEIVRSRSTQKLASEVYVRHRSGGRSKVSLKAYTQIGTGQGSLPMAGSVVDKVRCDEQPPDEVIGQLHVRTLNGNGGKGGKIKYTLTPELGETQLIVNFTKSIKPSQELVGPISWDEAAHLTPSVQQEVLAGIPSHEHDMRRRGIPFFAGGLVFPISEEQYKCEPFDIKGMSWFRCLKGIDLGVSHPTAVAWLAYDPESDITYLTRTWRKSLAQLINEFGENVNPVQKNADAINAMWPEVPLVFPHDIDQTEKGTGKSLRSYYRKAGISRMIDFTNPTTKPTHEGKRPARDLSVEVGIQAMHQGMADGTFKVFSNCTEFFEESRSYHRKNGQRVKEREDTIDAVRMAFQMIKTKGVSVGHRPQQTQALGTIR